ncbi:uncharacterized protein LOC115624953 [Scaptodrosophila lebanonensis]|uniref:Uncharacterized protein LOC115624953 n=1 Tax=Drosophila lebanonensis TaxID=7225 RepID=A0A6J2TJM3_DROLE|nr:uncharacterized protein LOC115624953 [Scaptodrosophila lebanonensis]
MFNAFGILLGDENVIGLIGRSVYMVHCIGSILLFIGAFLKMSIFLLIYLITDILHIIFGSIFLFDWWLENHQLKTEIVIGLALIMCSIYFWLVVYSYYVQCKSEGYYEED